MISVYNVYNAAFGYRGLPFVAPPVGASPSTSADAIDKDNYSEGAAGKSPADVLATIKDRTPYEGQYSAAESISDGLNHNGMNGVYYYMPISIGGVQLPNEPTIAASNKKHIVETRLVGSTRRGTVKEMIGEGDYEIRINGVCVSEDGRNYPFDQVAALKEIYARNEALDVISAFTEALGISRLVIKSLDWVEMKGISHCQAYKISAVSDEDFVLIQE